MNEKGRMPEWMNIFLMCGYVLFNLVNERVEGLEWANNYLIWGSLYIFRVVWYIFY